MNAFATGPVLVPWDFSEQCQAALKLAVEMTKSDVPIEVVYVSDSPANFLADVAWDSVKEDIIAKTAGDKFKNENAIELPDRVKFSTQFGNPGMEIVNYATQIKASVIVMSTHGRSGLSRLLIGSVADRVVHNAPCPVLLLRNS